MMGLYAQSYNIAISSNWMPLGTPTEHDILFRTNDDVIKWKHFPRYLPFVQGIHRSPVNSPHKGQWRGALMFSLICIWINGWINNREAGDLRRYRSHYDASELISSYLLWLPQKCRWFMTIRSINHASVVMAFKPIMQENVFLSTSVIQYMHTVADAHFSISY